MPTNLPNPFAPFITALESSQQGHHTIHGSHGQSLGSIDVHGTVQHLHDELGRNIGTIDHLSHGSASLHSASGASLGSAHTTGDTTVVTDRSGAHEASIHHGMSHDTIENDHHGLAQTVDHLGHTDVFHDAHGTVQTVDHI